MFTKILNYIFPPSLVFLWKLTFIYVLALGILRFVLAIYHFNLTQELSFSEFCYAFYIGGKFDLRLSLILLLPFFIFLIFPFTNPWKLNIAKTYSRIIHNLWAFVLAFGILLILIFYTVDFANFAWLKRRMDFLVILLAKDFDIAFNTVWQDYPILTLTLSYIFIIILSIWLFKKSLLSSITKSQAQITTSKYSFLWSSLWRRSLQLFIVFSVNLLLIAVFIHGKPWAKYSLRWSDANFTSKPFATQLALNPVETFYETSQVPQLSANLELTKKYYPLISEILKPDTTDNTKLNYLRTINAKPHPLWLKTPTRPLNIIIVIYEGFAAHRSSIFGNPLDPSPFMAKLAKEGILFTRMFTAFNGTPRGVFTILTGIPDISINEAAMRIPQATNQHIIIDDFENYEKYFFVGSSASWANLRSLLNNNVKGIKIYDEDVMPEKAFNYWGIPDHALFHSANEILAKNDTNKPFVAFIQTISNHNPFTWPPEVENFPKNKFIPKKADEVSEQDAITNGFASLADYNIFRYADFSVERFISEAKTLPFFDDTIFLFIGDEGLVGTPPKNMDKEWQVPYFRWNYRHTPMIIYSPKYLPAKVFDYPVSQNDVQPTIASLAGLSYRNNTLGRDAILDINPQNAMVFTFNPEPNPEIGVLDNQYYYLGRANMSNNDKSELFDYRSSTPEKNIAEENPQKTEKLKQYAHGFYETSRYLLLNNQLPKK